MERGHDDVVEYCHAFSIHCLELCKSMALEPIRAHAKKIAVGDDDHPSLMTSFSSEFFDTAYERAMTMREPYARWSRKSNGVDLSTRPLSKGCEKIIIYG